MLGNLFKDKEIGRDSPWEPEYDQYENTESISLKIMKMLELDEQSKATAVLLFLWCHPHTGKTKLADKICSNLQQHFNEGKWNQVTIKNAQLKRVIQGLKSDIDVVPALRSEILNKLPPEKRNREHDKNLAEIVEDNRKWQKQLSNRLNEAKKVFIYIDNILTAEVLKKLLPKNISKDSRIRILVTIQDKNVYSALKGSIFERKLYVMKPLSFNDALLFFGDKLGHANTEKLVVRSVVRQIIKICNGYKNPMKIVREHMFKYYTDDAAFSRLCEWIKMEEPNFTELCEYLAIEEKFLYLPPIIKDALLDICSFFNGWEWDETASIVENYALDELKELELVNRVSNKVSVPLTVMAFSLSRGQGNRITNAALLYTALAEKKIHAMKGIWLLENKFPFHISSDQLDQMHASLRILALGDWTIVTGKCKNKFKELRYFQAGSNITALPFDVGKLDHARFLDNKSLNDMGIIGHHQVPRTLRMVKWKAQRFEDTDLNDLQNLVKACKLIDLDISDCAAEKLSKVISEFHFLQKLIVTNCNNMASLPESFGKLRCLKMLDLSYCAALSSLPSSFGWLSCLEKIKLSYCKNLKHLPDSIGLLSSVKEIDLSYCKSLDKLPESFVKLSTLRVLNLRGCTHLRELPQEFEDLALDALCLESCKRLKSLPETAGQVTLSQKTVSLGWCFSVAELSKGFIGLISAQVEHLILIDCIGLQELPEEFSKELCRLKSLNLGGCRNLARLPKHFHSLQYLEYLNLSWCEKLEESCLRCLNRLQSLKELNLSNCQGLKGYWFNSLGKIQSLRFVDIHDSLNLMDRWDQLNRENNVCHFTAATARPALTSTPLDCLPSESFSVKGFEKKASMFFNNKWFFVDLNGRAFYPSALEDGTTLAVILDGNYEQEELQGLGTTLDHLRTYCEKLQILHVGKSTTALARELSGRHRLFSCDDYGATVFFEKALCSIEAFDQTIRYGMIISKIVSSEKRKHFSVWKSITNESLRALTKDIPPTEYLQLKELIENPPKGSIELLRELLLTKETNFLITSTRQVEIKDFENKIVFLLMSWLDNFENEYIEFKNLYEKNKKEFGEKGMEFELIWIPIVSYGRGTRALHLKWVKEIAWPTVADPWSMNPVATHFFHVHSSFEKLPLLIAVYPDGHLYFENLFPGIEEERAETLLQRYIEWKKTDYRQFQGI